MAVNSITILAGPGLTYVQDARLVGVQVKRVTREGVGYVDKYETLSPDGPLESREFQYYAYDGSIYFLNEFTGPTGPGRPNRFAFERVIIKYES